MLAPDVKIVQICCVFCRRAASVKFQPGQPLPWPSHAPTFWTCPDRTCNHANMLIEARRIVRVWPGHDAEPAGRDEPLDLNHSSFAFLRTEIATGMTFADAARTAVDNPDRRARNRHHALVAYETARRFRSRARLAPNDADEIQAKLEALRTVIEDIPAE